MIIWTDTVKCYLYGPTKTHIIIVNGACTSHDVRSTIAFQRILTLRYILFYESSLLNNTTISSQTVWYCKTK